MEIGGSIKKINLKICKKEVVNKRKIILKKLCKLCVFYCEMVMLCVCQNWWSIFQFSDNSIIVSKATLTAATA